MAFDRCEHNQSEITLGSKEDKGGERKRGKSAIIF